VTAVGSYWHTSTWGVYFALTLLYFYGKTGVNLIYRSAAICVNYVQCSTVSSASACTSHSTQYICCIICSILNCSFGFGFGSYLTQNQDVTQSHAPSLWLDHSHYWRYIQYIPLCIFVELKVHSIKENDLYVFNNILTAVLL